MKFLLDICPYFQVKEEWSFYVEFVGTVFVDHQINVWYKLECERVLSIRADPDLSGQPESRPDLHISIRFLATN